MNYLSCLRVGLVLLLFQTAVWSENSFAADAGTPAVTAAERNTVSQENSTVVAKVPKGAPVKSVVPVEEVAPPVEEVKAQSAKAKGQAADAVPQSANKTPADKQDSVDNHSPDIKPHGVRQNTAPEVLRYSFTGGKKSAVNSLLGRLAGTKRYISRFIVQEMMPKGNKGKAGNNLSYKLTFDIFDKKSGQVMEKMDQMTGLYSAKRCSLQKTATTGVYNGRVMQHFMARMTMSKDSFLGKDMRQLIVRNYKKDGVQTDENGRYNETKEILLEDDLSPMNTVGFALYLYKCADNTFNEKKFYYVDKGFIKIVNLKKSAQQGSGGNCIQYDVVYKNTPVLSYCMSKKDRKPVWMSFNSLRLSLVK